MTKEAYKPNEKVKASGEASPEVQPNDLMLRIRQALEKKEGRDTLFRLGDLMYETFKDQSFTPDSVLSAIKEIHDQYKGGFTPPLGLLNFIRAFGPGLVRLCQQKLLEKGGYNLGQYGKEKNGVDGKMGKRTKEALDTYFNGGKRVIIIEEPVDQPDAPPKVKAAPPGKKSSPPKVEDPPQKVSQKPVVVPPPVPETAGYEKPTVSPKKKIQGQVEEYYQQYPTTFTQQNLPEYFGKTKKEVQRFIIYEDPITHEPLKFLGQTIDHTGKSGRGINPMTLVFLRIAEDWIRKEGINYVPKNRIGGFAYRNMDFNGVDSGRKSHHAYGLAIDLDPASNGPANGRGDIPDQVVLAMVRAGFAWGGIGGPGFTYLGKDPMHFQLRFPADSPQGLAIINSSEVGQRYWKVVQPMLEKMKAS